MIRHFPVMAQNILQKIANLRYSRPIRIADCNFGFGGHSHRILRNFPNAHIQGIDLDPLVLEQYQNHHSSSLSEEERKRLHTTQANFASLTEIKIFPRFDVVLADFGFNSFHLETDRGFTWLQEQNLDMRYNSSSLRRCSDLINEASELQLQSILRKFGELKTARATAAAIMKRRPIHTTIQLRDSVVGSFQKDKPRKIAQVFQAFRIATNHQLSNITQLCRSLPDCLQPNGMFLAVTFHSLERDMIHNYVREFKGKYSKIVIDSPSEEEISQNSKSRSARLLSFRRIS